MIAKGVSNGTLMVEHCILAASTAVAWVYALELNITIFLTFKRKGGLYFWSLLLSSWGLTFHALGFVLKFLVGTSWLLSIPLITTGWVAMVTGQSFVLYSRLHLVVRDQRLLRYILYLILTNVFALHLPTVIFTYGSNSPNPGPWIGKFNIMERIQLAGFCIQETILSAVYVWATVRMLGSIYHRSTRKVMFQLILINSCCMGMDLVLICLEYTNNYVGEASIKPMIYAIKLKLEFIILNQLMSMATVGLTEGRHQAGVASYELHSNPSGGDKPPLSSKTGIRRTAAVKDSAIESRPENEMWNPNEIYMTHQIEVTREDASTNTNRPGDNLNPSGPTAPAPTRGSNLLGGELKAKSLMGTTHVLGHTVSTPGRLEGPRGRSPSESQQELFRAQYGN